jgi:hypothetical protein
MTQNTLKDLRKNKTKYSRFFKRAWILEPMCLASTTSNNGKSNSWRRGLALMGSYMAVVAAIDGVVRKSNSERVKE